MSSFQDTYYVTAVVYHLSVIILTIIAVVTSIRIYMNQRKPPKISARINYNLDKAILTEQIKYPVTIDIINHGDIIAQNVEIELKDMEGNILSQDKVDYVAPAEVYGHFLGYYCFEEKKIIWYTNLGTKEIHIQNLFLPNLYATECFRCKHKNFVSGKKYKCIKVVVTVQEPMK